MVFSSDNQDIVNGTVVPIPSKQTAGVYIFKSVYGHIVVGPTNIKQEDKFDRIRSECIDIGQHIVKIPSRVSFMICVNKKTCAACLATIEMRQELGPWDP